MLIAGHVYSKTGQGWQARRQSVSQDITFMPS